MYKSLTHTVFVWNNLLPVKRRYQIEWEVYFLQLFSKCITSINKEFMFLVELKFEKLKIFTLKQGIENESKNKVKIIKVHTW